MKFSDFAVLKKSTPGVIIAIAREHGSSGKQIGKMVAEKLGIPFYYKEMIALAAHESGLDREFISDIHKNAPDILHDLYLSTQVVQHAIMAQDKIIHKIDQRRQRRFHTLCLFLFVGKRILFLRSHTGIPEKISAEPAEARGGAGEESASQKGGHCYGSI